MRWNEALTLILTTVGVLFLVISAIGILRMPDLYTRVHTSGKAGTLGVAAVLLGVAIATLDLLIAAKMIALVALFFLTGPAAAHMLDRAAYLNGVKPMPGTRPDDLEGRYDPTTKQLH